MNKGIRKLNGANMDVDLNSPEDLITWKQDSCPWNDTEQTLEHKGAIKNISVCQYYCGIEYLDSVLCCYPHENPFNNN